MDDDEMKKASEARAADDGDTEKNDADKDRSEAAENAKKKNKLVLPPGDHSVFQPGEAGDPGDKGLEGYTQMPYDYR